MLMFRRVFSRYGEFEPVTTWSMQFTAIETGFRVVLKRNCSISPRGLLRVFAFLAALAMGIGVAFAALGAWLILPFAGLEVLLLGAAFLLTARHAADHERIELACGRLIVDVGEGMRVRHYEWDARLARVRLEQGRVLIDAPRAQVEVGRHLDAASRAGFAAELGNRLHA
jgi:uncharacterized membrane protein